MGVKSAPPRAAHVAPLAGDPFPPVTVLARHVWLAHRQVAGPAQHSEVDGDSVTRPGLLRRGAHRCAELDPLFADGAAALERVVRLPELRPQPRALPGHL